MSGHTPGPWRPNGYTVETANAWGLRVAQTHAGVDLGYAAQDRSQALANTRLMAAAPELLEQLCDLLAMVERQRNFSDDKGGGTIGRCKAAIAKAEGRS